MPRRLCAGPVTLDLFHRDGSVEGAWLHLHPREFELLWRLAESPRQRLSRRQLLAEVWRIDYDLDTNRVEVHVARVRAKLHAFGLSWLIATDPLGGYSLDADASPMMLDNPRAGWQFSQQYLDSYLRISNDENVEATIALGTGDTDAIPSK